MTKVLIVDDEPQILRTLRINLQARHYDVVTAVTGRAALQAATESRPDLIILDLGLPDLEGVEVVRSLRTWTQIPVLILSGRLDSRAKVQALDAGADDYVTKPFNVEELLARVRAVTRRVGDAETNRHIRIGSHVIDLEDRQIENSGPSEAERSRDTSVALVGPAGEAQVHLTPTEWQLLIVLTRNPGRLVSQRHLLQEVWGPTYIHQTHYLRQYVKTLRRKLEGDPTRPRHLITEIGMGYRFQP